MAKYGPLTPLVIDEPEDAIAPNPANPDRMLRQTAPRTLTNPNVAAAAAAGPAGNNAPQLNPAGAGPPALNNFSLAPMSTVHPLDAIISPGIVVLRAEFIKLNFQVTMGAFYFPGNAVHSSIPSEYLFRIFLNDATECACVADTDMVNENTIFNAQGGLCNFQQMTTLTRPVAGGGCENIGTINHQTLTVIRNNGNSLMNFCYNANYGQEGTNAVFSIFDNSNPAQLIAHILAFRQSVFLRIADNQLALTKEHKAVLLAAAIKIFCSVFNMNAYPLRYGSLSQLPRIANRPPSSLLLLQQANFTRLRFRAAHYWLDGVTIFIEAFRQEQFSEAELVFQVLLTNGWSACMNQFRDILFCSSGHYTNVVSVSTTQAPGVPDVGKYTVRDDPNYYFAPYSLTHPTMVKYETDLGQGVDIPAAYHNNPPTHTKSHHFFHFGTDQKVGDIKPDKASLLVNIYDDAAADERALILSTAITLAITDYQLPQEIMPRFRGYVFRT